MAVESNYHVFFGLFGNRLKVGIISALRREHMGVNELSKKLGDEFKAKDVFFASFQGLKFK